MSQIVQVVSILDVPIMLRSYWFQSKLVKGAQYSVCCAKMIKTDYLTFENLLLSLTDRDSSPTSQIRRYSPDVAIKSGCVPFYRVF